MKPTLPVTPPVEAWVPLPATPESAAPAPGSAPSRPLKGTQGIGVASVEAQRLAQGPAHRWRAATWLRPDPRAQLRRVAPSRRSAKDGGGRDSRPTPERGGERRRVPSYLLHSRQTRGACGSGSRPYSAAAAAAATCPAAEMWGAGCSQGCGVRGAGCGMSWERPAQVGAARRAGGGQEPCRGGDRAAAPPAPGRPQGSALPAAAPSTSAGVGTGGLPAPGHRAARPPAAEGGRRWRWGRRRRRRGREPATTVRRGRGVGRSPGRPGRGGDRGWAHGPGRARTPGGSRRPGGGRQDGRCWRSVFEHLLPARAKPFVSHPRSPLNSSRVRNHCSTFELVG